MEPTIDYISVNLVLVGLIIFTGIYIISAIFKWKIFQKAGREGWEALIPFYSSYLLYKIAWDGKFYLMSLGCILLAYVLGSFSRDSIFFVCALCALTLSFYVIRAIKLARVFDLPKEYIIGLVFLSPVFYGLIAMSSSKYTKEEK